MPKCERLLKCSPCFVRQGSGGICGAFSGLIAGQSNLSCEHSGRFVRAPACEDLAQFVGDLLHFQCVAGAQLEVLLEELAVMRVCPEVRGRLCAEEEN